MSIVLILGAGGSDGGRFIDGALAQLRLSTGFRPAHAGVIIGTSIGGFRAGSAGPAEPPPEAVVAALRRLGRPPPPPQWTDGLSRRFRIAAGRLIVRVAPRFRPPPAWDTPPGPFHAGAWVVTIDVDRRRRAVHDLDRIADPAAAIRGSAAIPFTYGPVPLGRSRHADGALWSPTSVDLAADENVGGSAEVIVVIAPMIPTVGGSVLERLHRRQLRSELAELPPGTAVVVLGPEPGARSETRTSRAGAAAVRRVAVGLATGHRHVP